MNDFHSAGIKLYFKNWFVRVVPYTYYVRYVVPIYIFPTLLALSYWSLIHHFFLIDSVHSWLIIHLYLVSSSSCVFSTTSFLIIISHRGHCWLGYEYSSSSTSYYFNYIGPRLRAWAPSTTRAGHELLAASPELHFQAQQVIYYNQKFNYRPIQFFQKG